MNIMNIYQRVCAFLLVARIEYHWWWILRFRKLGEEWIGRGEELTSPRLLRLNHRMNCHGQIAKQCEKYYREHYITSLYPEKALSR